MIIRALAVVGLLFYAYAAIRVYRTLEYRTVANRITWLLILAVIGGACIGMLGRQGYIPFFALLAVGLLALVVMVTRSVVRH